MLYGLQTHFNAPLPDSDLSLVKSLGFDLCRVDAQNCFIHIMKDMVNQSLTAGLTPLVIVGDLNTLRAVPAGLNVEWKNEPDIALGRPIIPPDVYASEFREAAVLAEMVGVKLWGPVISNLNKRGFEYLKGLGELPPNVGVSVHRYGDGSFEKPHKLTWWPWGKFQSREAEIEELKSLIGDRPFGVSEFGYPSHDDISEAQQAERISQEWELWKNEGASFAVLYQLNDGEIPLAPHKFGIKRFDGTLKPSAHTVPPHAVSEASGEDMPIATEGIEKKNLIALGGNLFVAKYPSNKDTVLSIQPDGNWETRPAGTVGPWEVAELKGDALVYSVEGHTYFVVVK